LRKTGREADWIDPLGVALVEPDAAQAERQQQEADVPLHGPHQRRDVKAISNIDRFRKFVRQTPGPE
jgi:hypothetical protein